MALDQGIPTIESYNNLLESSLFRKMETFSNQFLKQNKSILKEYGSKWVSDPLHQWSRQYEYPFVYTHVWDYLNEQRGSSIRILDAGSGVTFFPYYLSLLSPSLKTDCCDYDVSLKKIFSKINKFCAYPVNFCPADIRHLPFKGRSYDMVYCISVMEHTENYELIIQEFKRILKQDGLLMVTFDISIDSSEHILRDKSFELIDKLEKYFRCKKDFDSKQALQLLNSEKILTTRYINEFDKNLLPWKYSWPKALKSILRLRIPEAFFSNLTCFCEVLMNT